MNDAMPWLLEMRLFRLRPGTRPEFARISQEETIPLMRRIGITVLAHGSSRNNENGYFLLRAFASEQERVELSQSLYATQEWIAKYDAPVTAMIEDYDTTVFTLAPELLDEFARPSDPVRAG